MSANQQRTDADHIKICCADLYSSDLARWILGDSFHPGGLGLTTRLGDILQLQPGSNLLDVACGRGTSAIHLAETFGCRVTGIDFSATNIEVARTNAHDSAAGHLLDFHTGDAERLPFEAATFDAVICECSFCTFPDKRAACDEFARVLCAGGRIGLSDLTRSESLPPELDNILGRVMCIADARPATEYETYLRSAGFDVDLVELQDDALHRLIADVRAKLLGAQLVVRTQHITIPGIDMQVASRAARVASQAVSNGTLSYVVIAGSKPPPLDGE